MNPHASFVVSIGAVELACIILVALLLVILHRSLNSGPDLREELVLLREQQAQDRSNLQNVAALVHLRSVVSSRAALTHQVNRAIKDLVREIEIRAEEEENAIHEDDIQ